MDLVGLGCGKEVLVIGSAKLYFLAYLYSGYLRGCMHRELAAPGSGI